MLFLLNIIMTEIVYFYVYFSCEKHIFMRVFLCTWPRPTWSRDAMNVSKLALSVLIPDFRQLGHVHLYGLAVQLEEEKKRKAWGTQWNIKRPWDLCSSWITSSMIQQWFWEVLAVIIVNKCISLLLKQVIHKLK